MPTSPIPQAEADRLLATAKRRANAKTWSYPSFGGRIVIPLTSMDKRETFQLDVTRNRIDMKKGSYQNRARTVVILARLDFGGKPHRNPDGQSVRSPHLHQYLEGFGDRWAFEVPSASFPTSTADPWTMLKDFMSYCNIVDCPIIESGLEPA